MTFVVLLNDVAWLWIVVLVGLVVGGYFFLDKLMRKGIYEKSTEGRSRINSAISEMQTLVDPGHRHVIEVRERKRAERDDAGDDPDAAT